MNFLLTVLTKLPISNIFLLKGVLIWKKRNAYVKLKKAKKSVVFVLELLSILIPTRPISD